MTAKEKGDNADCPEGVTRLDWLRLRFATNSVESRSTVTGTSSKAKGMRCIAKGHQRGGLVMIVRRVEFDAKATRLLKARP
jgi:hypothetical protein